MKFGSGPTVQERPFIKPSRKKSIVWGGVAVFVALWMFALGVLVGRGTAPVHFDMEKLQNELAALKRAVQNEEKDRFSPSPDTLAKGSDLGFHEALKNNAETPRPVLPPSPRKRLAPPTPAAPAAVPQGRLTVQVASLKDVHTADDMVAQLRAKGFPAYRAIGKIPGRGIWYRVRVGGFESREEARQMLARLSDLRLKGILVNR